MLTEYAICRIASRVVLSLSSADLLVCVEGSYFQADRQTDMNGAIITKVVSFSLLSLVSTLDPASSIKPFCGVNACHTSAVASQTPGKQHRSLDWTQQNRQLSTAGGTPVTGHVTP